MRNPTVSPVLYPSLHEKIKQYLTRAFHITLPSTMVSGVSV